MEIIFHSHANNTHVGHLASFWKRGFLELGSGLLECGCWYWGYKGRTQRGRAVSALDLQSEDPGFNTRPNRLLDLFKSSTKVVNIQLVCLYAVGIVSLVTCMGKFQVVSSLCFKTKLIVQSLWYENDFLILKQMKFIFTNGVIHTASLFLKWGLFEYGNGLFDLFLSVICSVSPVLAR